MICPSCGDVAADGSRECPRCGVARVPVTTDTIRSAVDQLAAARLRALVDGWIDRGLVHRDVARTLVAEAERSAIASPQIASPQIAAAQVAGAEVAGAEVAVPEVAVPEVAGKRAEAMQPSHVGAPPTYGRPAEHAPQAAIADGRSDEPTTANAPPLETAAMAPVAALGPLTALDDTARASSSFEYVGWFVGALLVLAGSIYGVREAWLVLGAIARHVTVAAAFFAYHTAFVGLSVVLGRRSAATGGMLGAIALGLLPIAFVALAGVASASAPLAAALAIAFAAGSILTVGAIATRIGATRRHLLVATLPSSVAIVAVAPAAGALRLALPSIGIVVLALVRRTIDLGTPLAAAYAAAALGIFAFASGPASPVTSAGLALFVASFAAVVAIAATEESRTIRTRAWWQVVPIVALAILLCCVCYVGTTVIGGDDLPSGTLALLHAATAVVASAACLRIGRTRASALHFAAPSAVLASVLGLGSVEWHSYPASIGLGIGLAVGGASLLVLGRAHDEPRRGILFGWGAITSAAALAVTPVVEALEGRRESPFVISAVAATLVAVVAAGCGGARHRRLHYLVGAGLVVAVSVWILPSTDGAASAWLFGAAAIVAGFAGLAFDALAPADRKQARPYDDLSAFLLGVTAIIAFADAKPAEAFGLAFERSPSANLLGLVGVAFGLRSLRDRSAMPTILGALVLTTHLSLVTGATTAARCALVVAAASTASTIFAHFLRRKPGSEEPERPVPRHVFGVLPLPLPAAGANAIGDGLAYAAWIGVFVSLGAVATWATRPFEPERSYVVAAALLLAAGQALGFFTRAFERFGLRGSAVGLGTIAGAFATAEIVHRIGRPRAPAEASLRMTLVVVAVGAADFLVERFGARLAAALGRSEDPGYAQITRVSLVLLAGVLAVKILGAVQPDLGATLVSIPPVAPLGIALAVASLSRSTRRFRWLHLAAPFVVTASACATAQVPRLAGSLDVVARAAIGPSVLALFLAAIVACLARRPWRGISRGLETWIVAIAATLFVAAAWSVALGPAIALLSAGVVLAAVRRARAIPVVGLGALLVLGALADRFAGAAVAMAGVAAVALAIGPRFEAIAEPEEARSAATFADALAFVAALTALLHAARTTVASPTFGDRLEAVFAIAHGPWEATADGPVVVAILGIGAAVGARRGGEPRAAFLEAFAPASVAIACAWGVAVASGPHLGDAASVLRVVGPAITLALAVVAVAAEVFVRFARTKAGADRKSVV